MLQGAELLANIVETTFGPKGRNVIIDSQTGYPKITKDGVTVAKATVFSDPIHNLGCGLLKHAALSTSREVGDGTTASIAIARYIFKEGCKYIEYGANPYLLQKGINTAIELVESHFKTITYNLQKEKLFNIAKIAANNDVKIGRAVSTLIEKLNYSTNISFEYANSLQTSAEVINGFRLNLGYSSPYFVTNSEQSSVEFNDPLIMVTDCRFEKKEELLILDLLKKYQRPIVLMCKTLSTEVFNQFVQYRLNKHYQICIIADAMFGIDSPEIPELICAAVDAKHITHTYGVTFDILDLSI